MLNAEIPQIGWEKITTINEVFYLIFQIRYFVAKHLHLSILGACIEKASVDGFGVPLWGWWKKVPWSGLQSWPSLESRF